MLCWNLHLSGRNLQPLVLAKKTQKRIGEVCTVGVGVTMLGFPMVAEGLSGVGVLIGVSLRFKLQLDFGFLGLPFGVTVVGAGMATDWLS